MEMSGFTGTNLTRPRNLILAYLPEEQYASLAKNLVPVDLPQGMQLSQPNQMIEFVYFPVSGMISTDALTEKGESVEVGITGREGLSGVSALLKQPEMAHSVLMQSQGSGMRIRSAQLREEFAKGGTLQEMVHNYLYMQMVQTTQAVLCSRMHQLEERLSRWLLMSSDHLRSSMMLMTQEFLAQMLGARRSTVTVAAGRLQRQGLIDYSRGRIHIVNRVGLEKTACECYRIVRATYDRLLPPDFSFTKPPAAALHKVERPEVMQMNDSGSAAD